VTPITCGIVLAPRRLVAVVLGPGGEARRAIRAALTDDARCGLVQYLVAVGGEIVLTERLVRADRIARQALLVGVPVWAAPDALVAAITIAAAITGPPRIAAALARLPGVPLLRAQLRSVDSAAPEPRQVPLL